MVRIFFDRFRDLSLALSRFVYVCVCKCNSVYVVWIFHLVLQFFFSVFFYTFCALPFDSISCLLFLHLFNCFDLVDVVVVGIDIVLVALGVVIHTLLSRHFSSKNLKTLHTKRPILSAAHVIHLHLVLCSEFLQFSS